LLKYSSADKNDKITSGIIHVEIITSLTGIVTLGDSRK